MLAVAVGAVLAVSLALSQRRMRFSLEKLGPVAMVVLGLVILVTLYAFLHHSGASAPVAILGGSAVALMIVHAIRPETLTGLVDENAGSTLAALSVFVAVAWILSEANAGSVARHRPGEALAHSHHIPSTPELRSEKKVLEKKVVRETKKAKKDVNTEAKDLKQAARNNALGQTEVTDFESQIKLLQGALGQARRIRERHRRLREFLQALEQFDVAWLRKIHNVDLGKLTPVQVGLLRETMDEERKRVRIENQIRSLETLIESHSRKLEVAVQKAIELSRKGEPNRASAWILEAQKADGMLSRLHRDEIKLERWLLGLLRRQLADLYKPAP